ncbi:MAG: tetratricopeptide repeat protein [Candidatus Aminicenantes bacterium]
MLERYKCPVLTAEDFQRVCDQILVNKPQNSEAMYYRGRALRKLGRYDLALQFFQKVIDLKDKYRSARNLSPWSFIRRGYIFDLQGHREEAVKDYDKALVLPDCKDSKAEAAERLQNPYSEGIK